MPRTKSSASTSNGSNGYYPANGNGNGNQPWWARILEKYGIATVIALGACWLFGSMFRDYINESKATMHQQADSIQAISANGIRQTEVLGAQAKTLDKISDNVTKNLEENKHQTELIQELRHPK